VTRRLAACLLLAALAAVPARAQVIYEYRDAHGAIHLSNRRLSDQYQPFDSLRLPSGADLGKVMAFVRYYCRRYRLDPNLVRAMVEVESGFEIKAVSPKGAEGLMQIMPGTGRDLGLVDPLDGSRNLEAGIRYFKALLDDFGDVRLALAAYNAGPARVAKAGGVPDIPETRAYVDKVLARCGAR
jgi:soluble lytic murein transglycosylase-like protein